MADTKDPVGAGDPKVPKAANQKRSVLPLGPDDVSPENYRQSVQCSCGLWRLLPESMKEGDEAALVACPRCGWAPLLRHMGEFVELLQPVQETVGYEGEITVAPIAKVEPT